MHAADQEWILQLESSYLEIVYPPGLEHVDLTVTCGKLLQAHAHEWELARHDWINSTITINRIEKFMWKRIGMR